MGSKIWRFHNLLRFSILQELYSNNIRKLIGLLRVNNNSL